MLTFIIKHLHLIGMTLVAAGVILLVVASLTGLTTFNAVLLAGLFLVVLGVFLYVKAAKNDKKY